jgi:site-specific DNA-methyltransferase (adenine-specific)
MHVICNSSQRIRHFVDEQVRIAPSNFIFSLVASSISLPPCHVRVYLPHPSTLIFSIASYPYPRPKCRVCKEFLKDYGGKKSQAHHFGPLLSDVWNDIHRIRHKKRRDDHPCQLPIPLLERLILMTTDVGDIVLDPFVGTGTTAVAAKQLGRKYVGIEQDETYANIAKKNTDLAKETKFKGHFVSEYLGQIRTIRDNDWKEIEKSNSVVEVRKE